jgi:hypothetical protein
MSRSELVEELFANASLLIKRQLKLAELESKQQLTRGKTMARLLGAGGLFAYAAALMLLVAAALGLGVALGDRFWAGALLVGGALLVIAAVLGGIGWHKRVRAPLGRTRRELGKEVTWARAQWT